MRKKYQHVVEQAPSRPSQMKTFLYSAAMRSCIFVERCYSNITDVKVPSFCLLCLYLFSLILLFISISFALSCLFILFFYLPHFLFFFFSSSLPPCSVTRPTRAFLDLRESIKFLEYEGTFLRSARSLRRSVTSQKTGIRLMDLLLSRSTAVSFITIFKGE